MSYLILLLIPVLFLGSTCSPSSEANVSESETTENENTDEPVEARVSFYNVENLFDLEDNPDKDDDYYLPTADTKWDTERYNTKLDHISKVLLDMNEGVTPIFIGLSEIENKKVCDDLIGNTDLSQWNLETITEESLDNRGIDVALVYNKDLFNYNSHDIIRSGFSFEADNYTSRDILYVEGETKTGEQLHVFVCHWPSRRDGPELSVPRRKHVAENLKKKIDKIQSKDENAQIIVMGDFNDEPTDESVTETLGALIDIAECDESTELYNLMAEPKQEGLGTYNYRGTWNMLDQFVVSQTLLDNEGCDATSSVGGIFQEDYMMYESKKYGVSPSRTYGGPMYYGGYSDHLPIYFDLKF